MKRLARFRGLAAWCLPAVADELPPHVQVGCRRSGLRPLPLVILALLLAALVLVSLGLGKYPVSPVEVVRFFLHELVGQGLLGDDRVRVLEKVLLEVRLPRVAAAVLIGAALSVSGAAFQSTLVNPLVDPKLLGVLPGATFGAALGMVLFGAWYAVQISTFLGGLAALGVAVGIALAYRVSTIMLVLGGVISGALFHALLLAVEYVADPYSQLPAITYWRMGNMSMVDRASISRAGIPICLGLSCLILMARQLDALSMGDEEARALGVNVTRVRLAAITCATLTSTLTVVIAGTIDWVGLIVPHVARLIVGPNNETLLPASALLGAVYLLAVDDISRLAFDFEIPIGILTALIGIPFFVFVLRHSRKGWS